MTTHKVEILTDNNRIQMVNAIEECVREYMDTLGHAPLEKILYTRLHGFVAEGVHAIKRPRERNDRPEESTRDLRVLRHVQASLHYELYPEKVEQLNNLLDKLIAELKEEEEWSRDLMWERHADAHEDESDCAEAEE